MKEILMDTMHMHFFEYCIFSIPIYCTDDNMNWKYGSKNGASSENICSLHRKLHSSFIKILRVWNASGDSCPRCIKFIFMKLLGHPLQYKYRREGTTYRVCLFSGSNSIFLNNTIKVYITIHIRFSMIFKTNQKLSLT